jgi:multidrug efflux pump subunit AcrB
LKRPFSVLVVVIAVLLLSALAIKKMPRDILPSLGVPVLYVAQPYGGMDPAQMEGYLTYYYEYHFLYITGIEHVESKSIQGISLIKLQFHADTDMAQAMAETISYVNRARAFMPPGTVPPFVMRFDAGSVPVGNLVYSSDTMTVGELQDVALNRVRPLFATLPGVSAPPPFGGSARAIVVNVDPDKLRSYNLSPDDVVSAISSANTITPSGNIRIGESIPMVPINSIVQNIKDLETVAIKPGTSPAVFVRDVATVEDATDIPTGYALVNGRRTVYIPVTKRATASTLEVVKQVKDNLSKFQALLPPDAKVSYEFDQSPYVTRAMTGLVIEGLLGAFLTGLMILLFLRDIRSALVVILNIPVSILAAVGAMWLTGQTVNIMTLGGLALAVGILVDESTVTIENIHTHLSRGKSLRKAALDATVETTLPRLLAMLCILAVFIPSFLMEGAAKALFVPLSLAVGFSMIASYILSSTLVPILSIWLLNEKKYHKEHSDTTFDYVRSSYSWVLRGLLKFRWLLVPSYLVAMGFLLYSLYPLLGTEIFPRVDSGQFQLRLKAPTGTRIEKTEAIAKQVLEAIKTEAGKDAMEISIGFVGVQAASFPVNVIHLWTSGPEEAVLQVQLKPGGKLSLDDLQEKLRKRLAAELPDVRLSFEPSDIVSRVMSFGSPTPVEIAVSGTALPASQAYAAKVQEALMKIPALRDLQSTPAFDYPTVEVKVDRQRAGLMGVKTSDISKSLAASTWSSRFTSPVYWADPKTGVSYQVQVQLPTSYMASVEDVSNLPVSIAGGGSTLLRNVATVDSGTTIAEYDRYNMQRLVTLTANIAGEDLGEVSSQIDQALQSVGAPPEKISVAVRGQIAPLKTIFDNLRSGLLLAIVVIFLLLVANFQSPRLALVIVSTIPAVLVGVLTSLLVTKTTLNIQSFMGAIMVTGVAVANAILLTTFAMRSRMEGRGPLDSAVEGAASRLRPILMTTMAMLAGMLPMALAMGEGGEQMAPLGRAVIGGLIAGTLATLFILPLVFTIMQSRSIARSASLLPNETIEAPNSHSSHSSQILPETQP